MSWSGRSEAEPCCAGPLGAVSSNEEVARITIRPIGPPGYRAFTRSQFFPPANGVFNNECGQSSGCSVDRSNGLSDDDLRALSAARAEQRNLKRAEEGKPPSQAPEGAMVALVGSLRAIRMEERPNDQAVLIYDDPVPENDRHAVIRGREDIPEEERAAFLSKVEATFVRVITSP